MTARDDRFGDKRTKASWNAGPWPGNRTATPARTKDIAHGLGVSVVTVSRAFRKVSDIDPKTRARVLKRAEELHYNPNLAARALATGRTGLVGLVVPDLVHSFFAEIASGLSRGLRRKGFGLVMASSEEDPELEREEVHHLLARGVDVLLAASTHYSDELFREVEAQGVPYILLDRWFTGLGANFVGISDTKVGAIATEHLIQIGCRTIAHICGTRVSTARGRLEGYEQTLVQHGMAVNRDYIVRADHLDEAASAAGYRAALKLLDLDPRPDGIFCCNDPVAFGAMAAILDSGIRIPEEIALVGCGNLRFDQFLRVPLTTIDQRASLLGQRAAELALRLIETDVAARPKAILMEPQLIVRDSTTKPSQSSDRRSGSNPDLSTKRTMLSGSLLQ